MSCSTAPQDRCTTPASARNRGVGALQLRWGHSLCLGSEAPCPARCRSAPWRLIPGPGSPGGGGARARPGVREAHGPTPSTTRDNKGKGSVACSCAGAGRAVCLPSWSVCRVGRPCPGRRRTGRWRDGETRLGPVPREGPWRAAQPAAALEAGARGLARARLQGPSCPGSSWP